MTVERCRKADFDYILLHLAQNGPTAYVHLIAVHADRRGLGLGRQLYAHFLAFARAHGCTAIKAITTPTNQESIAFHQRLGMSLLGDAEQDGVPVMRDYSGPGLDRVVFHLPL
ncbi:MAG: GNAT family N-acetyltransferase [Anaerolineae bacterium]|nr:GNAT family N-acetyltransferase [Anaerolineae bacterium]